MSPDDRDANGEMVQTLKLVALQSQNVVNWIIKETANARRARASAFLFKRRLDQ